MARRARLPPLDRDWVDIHPEVQTQTPNARESFRYPTLSKSCQGCAAKREHHTTAWNASSSDSESTNVQSVHAVVECDIQPGRDYQSKTEIQASSARSGKTRFELWVTQGREVRLVGWVYDGYFDQSLVPRIGEEFVNMVNRWPWSVDAVSVSKTQLKKSQLGGWALQLSNVFADLLRIALIRIEGRNALQRVLGRYKYIAVPEGTKQSAHLDVVSNVIFPDTLEASLSRSKP